MLFRSHFVIPNTDVRMMPLALCECCDLIHKAHRIPKIRKRELTRDLFSPLLEDPSGNVLHRLLGNSLSNRSNSAFTRYAMRLGQIVHKVRMPGLEPGTSSLSVTRSNHLSYTRNVKEYNKKQAQPQQQREERYLLPRYILYAPHRLYHQRNYRVNWRSGG